MAYIAKRTNGTYQVRIRLKGRSPESATFDRKTDAVDWARKTEADIKAGRHFGVSKRHTLAELLDRYEAAELPRLKSAAKLKPRLEWWRNLHGAALLSDLTPDVIAKDRDTLIATPKQRGGGQRTAADVNRHLAALSTVCTFGIKELGWLDRNPLERVSKGTEAKGRVRYLSDDELPRFLDACRRSQSPNLYLAILLSLTTGGRQSEIMSLRWRQIDLNQRRATLGDTKNGDVRVLPLSGEAFELLQERSKVRNLKDDRLFPPKTESKSPNLDLRTPFATALRDASIKDFHWHDLRHTCASYLAMAGVSPLEISKILGHRTMAMVSRYSHLAPGHVVELGDMLAKRLGVGR